ncbi:cation transporter [Desulfuromonas versatilis]|uniref:Cation transporter n=1 Tax=Desulfuromonas versatilis TaxID=2802975 RepID=A0ABN6DXZ3_9BACT|nr:cation diffusion facilitator family transporter [Desulfuromonas versatilis]BCR04806.1 cation transporter [Desulfuromonas versatilis]
MTRLPDKIGAARLAIATAFCLAVLKLFAGVLSGSLAVLSSAIDSLLDILMSGVNYMAIRQAEKPADERHPFGHGKYETLATLLQATVITLSGAWIIFESARRLYRGVEPERLGGGILVLGISTAASFFISRHLKRVAAATDSSALKADSLHFAMDVYTNLALMVGLALISIFAVPWLDPVLSLLVGLYILYEALGLVRHGMEDVLDAELPTPVLQKVVDIIENFPGEPLGYHNLRTRRAGSQKLLDFHLTVCRHLSVAEAHRIADQLEKKIEHEILGSDVIIHIEPCELPDCPGREACRDQHRVPGKTARSAHPPRK